MKAIREREEVYHEVTSKYTMLSACYVINLRPPLYLRNALPVDIRISVVGCSVQAEGQTEGQNVVAEASKELIPNQPPSRASGHQEDFLDYGEKIVKPGDVLHLPTVKSTIKEGENKSLIVARVSNK